MKLIPRDYVVYRWQKLPPVRFTRFDCGALVFVFTLLLTGLILALLAGCSTLTGINPEKIVHELADDPATARIRVTGWGVVIEVDRTSPRTNSMPHSVGSERIDVGEQPR